MNSWTGIGNLGANPELRSTPSGRSVTNFAIAVDRRYNTFEVNAEKVHFLDRIRSTAEATDVNHELDTDVAESDYPTPQTVSSESFSTTS